jgi:hypothetical protein
MANALYPGNPRIPRWLDEPFRIFFPLAVLFGWIGVGHWLTYAIGVTTTYSCEFHGLVQMQAFMMAFAVGFLLTAVPRRTQTQPISKIEMSALDGALAITTIAAFADRWILSEISYGAIFLMLGQFAVRRFIERAAGRRPPAAFVLVPIAALQGFAGAALIASAQFQNPPGWTSTLGRLMVEQGVFLCLAVGIGGLVLPLMGGAAASCRSGLLARRNPKGADVQHCGNLDLPKSADGIARLRARWTLSARHCSCFGFGLGRRHLEDAGQDRRTSQASLDIDLAYAGWALGLSALA